MRLIFLILLSLSHAKMIFEAQICNGLLDDPVMLQLKDYDTKWAKRLNVSLVQPDEDFIKRCDEFPSILYNYSNTETLPLVVTLAGVLEGMPRESSDEFIYDTTFLESLPIHEATLKIFHEYGKQTKGVAKWNPGYDVHGNGNPFYPPASKKPGVGFIDLAVQRKMFVFFLTAGCVPSTKHHSVMKEITSRKNLVEVYGYDDTVAIAGDIFEAETTCTPEHNMGQIPSSSASNLRYHSHSCPKLIDAKENEYDIKYDKTKTYLTFIWADGDNLGIALGGRLSNIDDLYKECKDKICPPIGITLSPHLPDLAPKIFNYLKERIIASNSSVVLPPSGYLYSYPSLMRKEIQKEYIEKQLNALKVTGAKGVISWDIPGTWDYGLSNYYPKYGNEGCFFLSNVPYLFPVPYFYEGIPHVVNQSVVIPALISWYDKLKISTDNFLEIINEIPPGYIGYVMVDVGISAQKLLEVISALDNNFLVLSPGDMCSMIRRSFPETKRESWVTYLQDMINYIKRVIKMYMFKLDS